MWWASGSEGGQGTILNRAEEAFRISSRSEALKKCVCGLFEVCDGGGNTMETDELRFDNAFKGVFWVIAGLM